MALFLNQMQKLAKTPLIVAGDFERSVSMRVTMGARFPLQHGDRRDAAISTARASKAGSRRERHGQSACNGFSLPSPT